MPHFVVLLNNGPELNPPFLVSLHLQPNQMRKENVDATAQGAADIVIQENGPAGPMSLKQLVHFAQGLECQCDVPTLRAFLDGAPPPLHNGQERMHKAVHLFRASLQAWSGRAGSLRVAHHTELDLAVPVAGELLLVFLRPLRVEPGTRFP